MKKLLLAAILCCITLNNKCAESRKRGRLSPIGEHLDEHSPKKSPDRLSPVSHTKPAVPDTLNILFDDLFLKYFA